MKILWITNVEMQEIAEYFERKIVVGGWMNRTSRQLAEIDNVELAIVCPVCGEGYSEIKLNGISYYAFSKDNPKEAIKKIISDVHPDCIHVWGTEYSHSYYAICASEEEQLLDRTVVSIQGLVSVYAKHYTVGLPEKIVNGRTFKEWLGRPNIKDAQREMEKQGEIEVLTLKKAHHCIGRTDWDYACAKQINRTINYHFCNETLRSGFYQRKWEFDRCKKHRIFFSQAHYPIKGLHHLLEAMPMIRSVFPDTEIHIAGKNFLENKVWSDRLKQSSYQKYLISLKEKYSLQDCIKWQGMLSEQQMIQEFCEANVFVCTSNIENSSNSVGEAMLLGVPVVASDVGGIKSLLQHNVEGMLYQESAPYMLASYVIELFTNQEKAKLLGGNARRRAQKTHNEKNNIETLISIYKNMIENC